MQYSEEQIRQFAELRVFKRLITEAYPGGVVSVVSDTFDFWHAITVIAPALKEEILNRVPDQFGLAKTVFRPDSGDPVNIICGYKSITRAKLLECEWAAYDNGVEVVEFEDGTFFELIPGFDRYDGEFDEFEFGDEMSRSEVKGAIECLWDIFGGTTNELGYRTLNQRVGLIYGDSITPQRCEAILAILAEKGFASDNVVFGIGSYTFQYQTRDTFGFAMKATYVEIDGVGQAIFKDPKTDSGTKKSAKGLLCVTADETGKYVLVNDVCKEVEESSLMQTVFLNGEITKFQTLEEIRNRLASYE